MWVGVVLPQCFNADNKINLLAFICRKLAPTESNCDFRKWKLLAIVLALEDWKHWRVQGNLFWSEESGIYLLCQETQLPGSQVDIIYVTVLSQRNSLVHTHMWLTLQLPPGVKEEFFPPLTFRSTTFIFLIYVVICYVLFCKSFTVGRSHTG